MTFYNSYYPNQITLEQFIKGNGSIIMSNNPKRGDIIKKWYPVVESAFGFRLEESIMCDICIFCEVSAGYYEYMRNNGYPIHGNELADLVAEIKKSITSKGIIRSGVVRKVFNYNDGHMEYELEDGNFVRIKEGVEGPKMSVSKDIFPEEFVKHIDISLYRDMKIDQII